MYFWDYDPSFYKMIPRSLENIVVEKTGKKKAIIILGARQTGKTTLLKHVINNLDLPSVLLNADKPEIRQQLSNASLETLKQIIGKSKLIAIDEAQRITNIGLTLKLIVDEIPDVVVIATGSSSFESSNQINEPLTGRKYQYLLYPISWAELIKYKNYIEALSQLQQRIVFGMYPEVISNIGEEREILFNIIESYLYKDILAFQQIRKPEFIHKLLQALAFQVGNEVSYNELSTLLQIDRKTIINYIDILEKSFVVFRLSSFSRNLSKELTKKIKVYFYDTGIRNSLINDLRPFNMRPDNGALWENFIISERLKFNHYNRRFINSYFWRTHQKQEIDYIEEKDGEINAFEFKWNQDAKSYMPKTFTKTYKNSNFQIINSDNFHNFIN